MSTLYLTVGLPGSGKSTYAKQWVAQDLCKNPDHEHVPVT